MSNMDLKQLRVITDRPLHDASEAVLALGGLARWWLTDAALQAAREEADPEIAKILGDERVAQFRPLPGSCWILCAVLGHYELLRSAVVLPLCWKKEQGHSTTLPKSLQMLAERVLQQVSTIPQLPRVGSWGLSADPSLDLERTPLTEELFKTLESGWATLMGGLLTAILGLTPRPDVWASIQWNSTAGALGVENLSAKLSTAVSFGASAFAVALSQKEQAEKWVAENALDQLTIVPVSSPLSLDPWTTLAPYLARLSQRPEPAIPSSPESFERCRFYYITLRPFSEEDRRFKQTHLQAEIFRRCREKLIAKHPCFKASHFVTIVTPSSELQLLLAQTSGASHCLLLHTADLDAAVSECRAGLPANVAVVAKTFRQSGEMGQDILEAIEEFTKGIPVDRVVIDIKSATAKMKYWMSRAAKPGNWLFNLEARMLNDRRNDPGSELPEIWQA